MKHFIRFGKIPTSGRSVNFLKLGIEKSEDFAYARKNISVDVAYAGVPEAALEAGVSCFEISCDRMPVASNVALVRDLAGRIGEPIYEVLGEEVGRGVDGEPLVRIEKVLKTRRIKPERLAEAIAETIGRHFRKVTRENVEGATPFFFGVFYDWRTQEPSISFNGLSFSEPTDEFYKS